MLWRYSQVVRHGSAKAWSSVQIRLPPSQTSINEPSNGLFWYHHLIRLHLRSFASNSVLHSWKEKMIMKKVTLYALSILSLAMLAACQPAAPETHQRKPLVSSSKKSSKSSRSSYAKKSSSKKDFSSGFDDDHSHSSSDSNTREDPNYTMSLMDQGESLEAIGDIPEMPKWAAFK